MGQGRSHKLLCWPCFLQLRVRSRSSSILSAMFCRRVGTLQERNGWTNAKESVALFHPWQSHRGKGGLAFKWEGPRFPPFRFKLCWFVPWRFCRVRTRRQNIALKTLDDRLLTWSWKSTLLQYYSCSQRTTGIIDWTSVNSDKVFASSSNLKSKI